MAAKTLPKVKLKIDTDALKTVKLVAVAFSEIKEEHFPTPDAFIAEKVVEDRAQDVIDGYKKLGLEAKGYLGDPYLLTYILG